MTVFWTFGAGFRFRKVSRSSWWGLNGHWQESAWRFKTGFFVASKSTGFTTFWNVLVCSNSCSASKKLGEVVKEEQLWNVSFRLTGHRLATQSYLNTLRARLSLRPSNEETPGGSGRDDYRHRHTWSCEQSQCLCLHNIKSVDMLRRPVEIIMYTVCLCLPSGFQTMMQLTRRLMLRNAAEHLCRHLKNHMQQFVQPKAFVRST